jgi:glycosyltransferase involved in cell wall biosynthesis
MPVENVRDAAGAPDAELSMSKAEVASRPPPARRVRAKPGRGVARFVFSPSAQPCGVEIFTRELANALSDPAGHYAPLPWSGRWRDFPHLLGEVFRSDHIIFSFPLNACKRTILQPLLLLTASSASCRISVILHEWAALHWLRRLVLAPFVVVSDTIVVVSPYVADQLAKDRWIGRASAKCRLLPHPPTIRRPRTLHVTERVRGIARAARDYDIVIGTFGSIYKGKASTALLDICRHLNSRGVRALMVFVGSHTRSLDDYENEFRAATKQKGIEDHVIVTGYVEEEGEIFALFEQIGVFLFLFPEGMTARRSSVFAALQSDRPVVVSAPRSPSEFVHHAALRTAIENGAISLLPLGAGTAEISDRLLSAARRNAPTNPPFDGAAWWKATIEAARAIL